LTIDNLLPFVNSTHWFSIDETANLTTAFKTYLVGICLPLHIIVQSPLINYCEKKNTKLYLLYQCIDHLFINHYLSSFFNSTVTLNYMPNSNSYNLTFGRCVLTVCLHLHICNYGIMFFSFFQNNIQKTCPDKFSLGNIAKPSACYMKTGHFRAITRSNKKKTMNGHGR
jgi:hypothetical protein